VPKPLPLVGSVLPAVSLRLLGRLLSLVSEGKVNVPSTAAALRRRRSKERPLAMKKSALTGLLLRLLLS
jgi:hypothetical protein